jgi:predicted HTH domain antitoxin
MPLKAPLVERLARGVELYVNQKMSLLESSAAAPVCRKKLTKALKDRGLLRKEPKKISDKFEKAIKLYVDENLSVFNAAANTGVCKTALSKVLRERDLLRKTAEKSAANLEQAIALYVAGATIFAASRQAKVGNQTLGDALSARGLLRKHPERKPTSTVSHQDPLESAESRVSSMALSIIHSAARAAANHQGDGR